jgi:hypothetical protein
MSCSPLPAASTSSEMTSGVLMVVDTECKFSCRDGFRCKSYVQRGYKLQKTQALKKPKPHSSNYQTNTSPLFRQLQNYHLIKTKSPVFGSQYIEIISMLDIFSIVCKLLYLDWIDCIISNL